MDVMSFIASFPLGQAIKKQDNQGRLAAVAAPLAKRAGTRPVRRCCGLHARSFLAGAKRNRGETIPEASAEESRHRVREGSEVQGQNVLPL
jgi:hypothetical protein